MSTETTLADNLYEGEIMALKNSTVRKLKPQPKLTDDEIKRVAEKIAVRIEHDEPETALLMLYFRHLEILVEERNYTDIWSALYDFRQHLFLGTNASDSAQDQFQETAYRDRGKLLRWPGERREAQQ